MSRSAALIFLIWTVCFHSISCLRHRLSIKADPRPMFKIETFGFLPGGQLTIRVENLRLFGGQHHRSLLDSETISYDESKKGLGDDTAPLSPVFRGSVAAFGSWKSVDPRQLGPTETEALNNDVHNYVNGTSRRMLTGVKAEAPSPRINSETSDKGASASTKVHMGFVMRKATSESAAQEDIEKLLESKKCLLDHLEVDDIFLNLTDPHRWNLLVKEHEFIAKETGLYSLVFARCEPKGFESNVWPHLVSFELDAEFYNPGPNYLSAGDMRLPAVYLTMFFMFAGALAVWSWILISASGRNASVHAIHKLMLALLVVKCLTLLFESIRYHYIAAVGASEVWSAVYLLFAVLKGLLLFTVLLLMGSGWSLVKGYLNDREKRVILVVLLLQIVDNFAMVMLEETSPGSQAWLVWRDVLHLLDIASCCAILFPIVWSINHLQQAAAADGKASGNTQKLQLFREFYVMVVAYLYFTRIVVYLISAALPFDWLWLSEATSELAAFLFYVLAGYKFRPAADNPYLHLSSEDKLGAEYGLKEDQVDEYVSDKRLLSL